MLSIFAGLDVWIGSLLMDWCSIQGTHITFVPKLFLYTRWFLMFLQIHEGFAHLP